MRAFVTTMLLIATTVAAAQPTFVDLYGEDYHPRIGYRANEGQVIDTDGTLRPEVRAKSEGTPFIIWPREESTITYTWRTPTGWLHRVDVTTVGELANVVAPTFRDVKSGHHNYYYPHTAPNGAEGVLAYSRVDYAEIYPDIDMILYSGSGGPKLAYVVYPGGDPAHITLQFQGQDSLKVDDLSGVVRAYMDSTELLLPYVIAYQWNSNNNVDTVGWNALWKEDTSGDMLSFEFGAYDTNEPLVFFIGAPPAGGGGGNSDLAWSTTVGDDNASQTGGNGDFIWGADDGSDGSLYTAGHTFDSNFPANPGTAANVQGSDVYVAHYLYNPGQTDDAVNDWTTFVGGSGLDKAHALHVAGDGDVYVIGWTSSDDIPAFPIADPVDGSYWENQLKGSEDALMIKLEPVQGNIDRVATFGGDAMDYLTAITEDANGNIYLAGNTTSMDGSATCISPTSGMPLCNPGGGAHYSATNAGGLDVFIVRLDPNFHMTWGTFWGSTEDDQVFDLSPTYSFIGPANGFAMVGRTFGTIPAGNQTGYLQTGNGQANGFVATFNTAGVKQWATNVHGVNGFQAVAAVGQRLVVAGSQMEFGSSAALVSGCTATANSLCLCDPGNGAYMQTAYANAGENYIAEFVMPSGALVWGTILGGNSPEEPELAIQQVEWLDNQLAEHYRNMDLEIAPNGSIYFMGLTGQVNYPSYGDYPNVTAWGFYDRPFPANAGSYQSDVTLHGFTPTRAMVWATTFGSMEPTYQSEIVDLSHVGHGSDFGHDLVLHPNAALYWVGATGNFGYEDQCPNPGTSYCETQPAILGTDLADGFIARMNLTGLSIGVVEHPTGTNPALHVRIEADAFYLVLEGERVSNETYQVYDAIGRLVRDGRTSATGMIDVRWLAAGYLTAVIQTESNVRLAAPFVLLR